jgi:hypothetical protein
MPARLTFFASAIHPHDGTASDRRLAWLTVDPVSVLIPRMQAVPESIVIPVNAAPIRPFVDLEPA